MATKNIAFQITVDGKQLDLAKTSVNEFNKVYTAAQKKLNDLDIGTDEWKKLDSEIKNGNKAFEQTKEILSTTEGKFKSLKVQIRQATVAFQEAEANGDLKAMKTAKNNLDKLNDQFEIATMKSMQFEDALAQLPGVMGFVGQSIQGVDKGFKLLVANPMLAIVTAVVGAFMFLYEALGKTSKGQETLNKVQSAFSKILGPLLALIENVAVPIFEKLAQVISFVAEGFSWLVESLGVSSKDIKRVTKEIDTVSQEAAEKEKERQEAAKKREEERKKKAEEAAQKEKELAAARKQAAQDNINTNESLKQSEVELARVKAQTTDDELEKLKIEQTQKDNDYQRELKRINDLLKLEGKGTNEYKSLITERNNLEKDYLENKTERSGQIVKLTEDQLEAEKEFNIKIKDIQIAAITDETQRALAEREEQKKRDLQNIEEDKEFIKKSEIEKAEIRKNIEIAAQSDIKKIKDDAAQKEKDDSLKRLSSELQILQVRNETLTKGTQAYFENQRALLEKAYEIEKQNAIGNAELLLEIESRYQEQKKNLKQQEVQALGEVASATINAIGGVLNAIASSYDEEAKTSKKAFEQRKKLQVATALMSAASGIIQILTQPSTLPSPFDWIVKGANALALGISTGVQIANINKTKFEGASGGGAPSGQNLGQNYADGGLIGGRRHAQGGTMIEAEAGEAIMTRGAVTMFAPMLSMMNQMGGGTSFNKNAMVTLPDNPLVTNPAQEQNPLIMKTYVVENELTSMQQRQARLKDLSTL
jgi:hypothetical protein